MNLVELLSILTSNIFVYICCLFITAIIYTKISMRYTNSWADPFRIALVFIAFANTIPLFLFTLGYIEGNDFLYFIASELCFWAGFFILSKKRIVFSRIKLINNQSLNFSLFIIFLVCHIISTGFVYLNLGIPVFQESRLSVFAGTGLGTIQRISPYISVYCLFYSFYLLDEFENNFYYRSLAYLTFIIFFTTYVLSGSKGSLLIIVFSYYGYHSFYKNKKVNVDKKQIIFALSGALIVNFLTANVDPAEALINLLIRFVASGDIYWIAYPNQLYELIKIPGDNSFNYLFSGILAPLRIIAMPNFEDVMGFQFTRLLNPNLPDLLVGPNVRLPVLSQILFGWPGLFLCFLVGAFLSAAIFRIPRLLPSGIITLSFYTYFYITLMTFFTDVALGIGYLVDLAFNFVLMVSVTIGILIIQRALGGMPKKG